MISQGDLQIHDNNFTLTMPITKVDKENRIVSGFATLNNVDKQHDIVDAEASKKAFNEWAGNVRTMHKNDPAGKAVEILQKSVTAEDGQEYQGVYVDVYISKGAPNTWEMVLDETLKGFSIGGHINKYEMKDFDGESVRMITDYTLTELSLVDNPANNMAKIMSIVKSADGQVMIDSIYDKEMSKSSVILEKEPVMSILSKISTMLESLVKGDKVEKAIVQPDTSSVVQPDKRLASDSKRDADGKYIGTKGGSDLGTVGADVPGLLREAPDEAPDFTTEETVEEEVAADPEPTVLEKQLNSIVANLNLMTSTLEAMSKRIDNIEKSDMTTQTLGEITDRLNAVEQETAQKQSGDIAKVTNVVIPRHKSIWDGAILKNW